MAHFIKKTTNITGLKVLKNPREELMSTYKRILKVLDKMPQDAAYKKYTAAFVNDRLKIVQETADPKMIEHKIGAGQCEELLVQANNELDLARRFLADKPWEPLVAKPPPNQWKWPI